MLHDPTGVPLAAVAVEESREGWTIDRLVVAPRARRRGLGGALVAAVLARAARADSEVSVSTGRANLPARRLYERFGFRHERDEEPVPGLWVSRYRWRQRRAVRVVCVDGEGAVLLLSWRDPVAGRLLHEPPGGGVEPGETEQEAAVREVLEETGLGVRPEPRARVVVSRDYHWNGCRVVASEAFLLAAVDAVRPAVRPAGLTRQEATTYRGHLWVEPDALTGLPGDLQPPGLARVVAELTGFPPLSGTTARPTGT